MQSPNTSERRKYERSGVAALYAFTPFKIIYSKETGHGMSYAILFASPWNYEIFYRSAVCQNEDIGKIAGEKGQTSDYERLIWNTPRRGERHLGYRVVIYREFPYMEFKKNHDLCVVVFDRRLHQYLTGKIAYEKIKEYFKRYLGRRFMFAEFNYQSLNNPRSCRFGLVLISHRDKCPLVKVCPIKEDRDGSCRYYFTADETYGGMFKVFPHVAVEISSRLVQNQEQISARDAPIVQLQYECRPLASVYYDGALSFIAYYAGIVFRPKYRYVFYDNLYAPMNRRWTIGVNIRHTQGLVIKFHQDTLKLIASKLENSPWIRFKCGLLTLHNIKTKSLLTGAAARNAIKPWQEMEKILTQKKYDNYVKKVKDTDLDKELVQFLIVHSLAHIYVAALRQKLGLSEDHLMYAINKAPDGSFVVYIFETASGGYGYIKALSREPDRLHEILTKALQGFSSENLLLKNYCGLDADIQVRKSDIENQMKSICQGTKNGACGDVLKIVNDLFEIYEKHKITLHPYTIRHVLMRTIPGGQYEKFRETVDKILTTFNSFDGNLGCGFLDEGCIYGPFLEPLTVSLNALIHVANVKCGVGADRHDIVKKWLNSAEKEVLIMTANMSENPLVDVLSKLSKRGVAVKILVGKNALSDGGATCKTAKKLREESQHRIEIRHVENLHSKAIIIDGAAVIYGSFNFTKSGLYDNVESIEISTEPRKAREYRGHFYSLWETGKIFEC